MSTYRRQISSSFHGVSVSGPTASTSASVMQAQHLQPLLGADQRANSLTISGSSVSRRNATSDIRRWFRIRNSTVSRASADLQALEHVVGHAHALERVLVVAPLADVVEQQREHEQLGRREPRRRPPEALRRARRCWRAARDCGSSAACARPRCTCGRSRAPPATRSPGTPETRGRAARSRASATAARRGRARLQQPQQRRAVARLGKKSSAR